MRPLVLDTNVVLDLFVFRDPHMAPLRRALDAQAFDWLATDAMGDELEHVLRYPNLERCMRVGGMRGDDVLQAFTRQSRRVAAAPAVAVKCRDEDDQKFIDLAVAYRALLLSKDAQVLKLRRRLAPLGVEACACLVDSPPSI